MACESSMHLAPFLNFFAVTMSQMKMRPYLVNYKETKVHKQVQTKTRLKEITKLNKPNIQYEGKDFDDNVKKN